MGSMVAGSYTHPYQEEVVDKADDAFLQQASHLQALVLTEDLSNCQICWRDKTAKHEQSRMFLECADDNVLTQVMS